MDKDTRNISLIAGSCFIGLFSALVPSYIHEINREKCVPLAFSEITQIENDLKLQGREAGPMTRYLTETNDSVMKILESWNIANNSLASSSGLEKRFTNELNKKMQNADNHHYGLRDLMDKVPTDANLALNEMKPLFEYWAKIQRGNNDLRNAWNESHKDVEHTELCTSIDDEGHLKLSTRTVYDYTNHSYIYNRNAGEEAFNNLSFIIPKEGDTLIERDYSFFGLEELPIVSKTNEQGENASAESRKNERKNANFTKSELLSISRTWRGGSTYWNSISVIFNSWDSLQTQVKRLEVAKDSAKSSNYRTPSHYDIGPIEYQLVNSMIDNTNNFNFACSKIEQSILQTKDKIPKLKSDIEGMIVAEGGSEKMRDIMSQTKEIYRLNFENGLEVEQFRSSYVFSWGLMGLIIGGLTGAGISYLSNKRK